MDEPRKDLSTNIPPQRCVNLDWLEVHCLEPFNQPRDPAFFRAQGFVVHERPYGTRIYNQMFTIDGDDGQPLLEVRRDPKSKAPLGLHLPEETHIRLHNRTCYFDNAAELLQQFIDTYGYEFRRITRADICLDFERFDYGDDPQVFLTRYIKHRYAKINQSHRTTHGEDKWSGCIDNSVSWGSPTSDIGTKMYNKTMELYNRHDGSYSKPYILWNWKKCGLIDNPIHCTKGTGKEQYTPQIWRVEFSIRSSVRQWFKIELNGDRGHYQSIRNTLSMYAGRPQLLTLFASLSNHYFHFKKFENGKRKDRCEDKLLFNWQSQQTTYKVGKTTAAIGTGHNDIPPMQSLLNKIKYYQQTHVSRDIHDACAVLIRSMEGECLRTQMTAPWSREELLALQQALSLKVRGSDTDIVLLLSELKELLRINDNTAIF